MKKQRNLFYTQKVKSISHLIIIYVRQAKQQSIRLEFLADAIVDGLFNGLIGEKEGIIVLSKIEDKISARLENWKL